MGIALNLYIALGHVDILTMLVVPVREHGRYFHFIVSFQTLICKDKCIPKFTAAFMVAKTWKQPVSFDRWFDKEDVVHIYNGILLSHKKRWNTDICDNMD